MLTLLLGTDWKQNKKILLQRISQDVAEEKPNRILMVPELISHQTERELSQYAGDTASRFAQVLSFTRLARRTAEAAGHGALVCMDDGGRIVAMAAATRQIHSQLKAYASVETRPEFLSGLIDAVDEFKRCCISSRDLTEASRKTQGNFAQKLEELALILESYDTVCQQGKKDPRDQMTWLLSELEDSDFAQRHTFYFDGFPDYSRQNMNILEHLITYSPNVTVTLTCDKPGSNTMAFENAGNTAQSLIRFAKNQGIAYQVQTVPADLDDDLRYVAMRMLQGNISREIPTEKLSVLHFSSVYEECTAAAQRVMELVSAGCRFRDIRIVCSDMASYENPLRMILQRAHIPIYLSGKDDILEKTAIHTVLTALDAALDGFQQKSVIRYMKSMLSPLDIELSDRMENYAITWSIDGKYWLTPWENHPGGLEDIWTQEDRELLSRLEEGRRKLMAPLEALYRRFRNAQKLSQQVMAVYDFLEDISLAERLEQLSRQMEAAHDFQNAQVLNQLWEILVGALEQLYDVLGNTVWDSDTFIRIFRLLLSQYNVGTIPSVLDAVSVGSVSAMRCQASRHLIFLGAGEGAFPSYGTNAGVLNDQERAALQKLGISINSGAIDGLQTQFSEITDVFSGSNQSVWVSYSAEQPSYIYNRLLKMAGKEMEPGELLGAALYDKQEAAIYLASRALTQEACALGLSEAYNAAVTSQEHTLGTVSEAHIKGLYGDKLRLSASQVDRLAQCKLSYFLQYGLRAKERKPVKNNTTEFGTYVHAVLEACGRKALECGGFRNISLEQTLELSADFSAKYFAQRFEQMHSQRFAYHFQKNVSEVKLIVEELWKEMQESDFQAYDFELSFGDGGIMPAIQIQSPLMDAQLRGFVDRVDLWQSENGPYIRVVDYKTGIKDFDYCDIYNGIGLQMLLYLYALEEEGKQLFGENPIPAGVQYFPARVPLVSVKGSVSCEEAEQLRQKNFKRKGLLLGEEQVLQAMEPGDKPKRLSYSVKKDGTLSGDIASRSQFKMLKKYIFDLLTQMVRNIAEGNITADPYTRGVSHSACTFCPYDAVCHSAEVPGRRNYQAVSNDDFWAAIEKEVSGNG